MAMKRSKAEIEKLKDWAKVLFCKEGRSQKDIAETVGVSERSISQWKEDGKWETYRQSLMKTKEEQLKELYAQVAEFNNHIKNKAEGHRFPDSKEADALKKMTSSIKDLETELNLSIIIEVGMAFTNYVRGINFSESQMIAEHIDGFIKTKIK